MTEEEKSLLRCTARKSLSVSRDILKWGLIGGILLLIVGVPLWGVWSGRDWICARCAEIVDLIVSIPWYAWFVLAIPCVIVAYSFVWCVARELTSEDWRSDIASTIADSIYLPFGVGSCLSGIAGSLYIFYILPDELSGLGEYTLCFLSIILISVAAGTLFVIIEEFICGDRGEFLHIMKNPESGWHRVYCAFLFPGACWNYKMRMKN